MYMARKMMNQRWFAVVLFLLLVVDIVVQHRSDCCYVNAFRTGRSITPCFTSARKSAVHRHFPQAHQQHQRCITPYPHRGGGTQQRQSRPTKSSTLSSTASDGIDPNKLSTIHPLVSKIRKLMKKNFFVLGMISTVILSYLFPTLGMTNGVLHPELWLNQYGVSYIFLLSGLSIQLSQIQQATANMKLNILVQLILFVIWPLCLGIPVQYLSHRVAMIPSFPISKPLLDGLLVLSTLPTTVNMCVILTSTVGGNVASALCNAVLSNLLGIVLTPILLFRFFGSDITLPLYDMVMKLMNKVLLPVMMGQLLRARVPAIKNWYYRHEPFLKRSQEVVLLGILWNAFCTAITSQLGMSFRDGIALLTILPIIHLIALAGTFGFFSWPVLEFTRGDVVAAMFCASQKTLAFGLPIVQTIFEGNANVAIYSAPLMIIHPIQLMIGSILVPRFERYIKSEKQENATA